MILKKILKILNVFLIAALLIGCNASLNSDEGMTGDVAGSIYHHNSVSSNNTQKLVIPTFDGIHYSTVINNNHSYFTKEEVETAKNEEIFTLSNLDKLGRCGVAMGVAHSGTIATTERGSIGMIKPSGWQTIRYDDIVEGKYLYNRCHLLMFAAFDGSSGGKTNVKENLITGTRYFNADENEGMLHYETILLNYIKQNKNRVLYRCTPYYTDDNLVADGVLLEAKSIEDNGKSLEFCVFVYNEQPGVVINHKTGESYIQETESSNEKQKYVININTNKFHLEDCQSVEKMKNSNKKVVKEVRQELINNGYSPCQICCP